MHMLDSSKEDGREGDKVREFVKTSLEKKFFPQLLFTRAKDTVLSRLLQQLTQ